MSLKLLQFVQSIIPQHLLTRAAGRLANCRWRWLKNSMILSAIFLYKIDLREAERESVSDYVAFNDFFTRKLKADARPMPSDAHAIVSPVDGFVSQFGEIVDGALLQAKGKYYHLNDLLAQDKMLVDQFMGGKFVTLYLSPRCYHRVHMPFEGKLLKMMHIPGQLFSVSPLNVRSVPKLFARNDRVVSVFETPIGRVAVIMVGALIVGGMKTKWAGRIRSPAVESISYEHQSYFLSRGDEVGSFELGSTVILLFEKSPIKWSDLVKPEQFLQMGESIAEVVSRG